MAKTSETYCSSCQRAHQQRGMERVCQTSAVYGRTLYQLAQRPDRQDGQRHQTPSHQCYFSSWIRSKSSLDSTRVGTQVQHDHILFRLAPRLDQQLCNCGNCSVEHSSFRMDAFLGQTDWKGKNAVSISSKCNLRRGAPPSGFNRRKFIELIKHARRATKQGRSWR